MRITVTGAVGWPADALAGALSGLVVKLQARHRLAPAPRVVTSFQPSLYSPAWRGLYGCGFEMAVVLCMCVWAVCVVVCVRVHVRGCMCCICVCVYVTAAPAAAVSIVV